jgi:hypothetical protein
MNKQELFDKVAVHLINQGKKSSNYEGCRYRHGELRCAIGCLIPDDVYTSKLEGQDINCVLAYANSEDPDTVKMARFFKKLLPTKALRGLALELQWIHDTGLSNDWYADLLESAVENRLSTKKLKAAMAKKKAKK